MRASEACSGASCGSWTSARTPATATTSAMPEPIWPAPTIPTVSMAQAAAPAVRPAASRSRSALPVCSHVKSGSSRPKWPYAAVF